MTTEFLAQQIDLHRLSCEASSQEPPRFLELDPGHTAQTYHGPFALMRDEHLLASQLPTLQDAANAFLEAAEANPQGLWVSDSIGQMVAWGVPEPAPRDSFADRVREASEAMDRVLRGSP
jgi:hypothetical protein